MKKIQKQVNSTVYAKVDYDSNSIIEDNDSDSREGDLILMEELDEVL